jgi:hypothetical protein
MSLEITRPQYRQVMPSRSSTALRTPSGIDGLQPCNVRVSHSWISASSPAVSSPGQEHSGRKHLHGCSDRR